MTIINNWQPARNSLQWEQVIADAEGPAFAHNIQSARVFRLWRALSPDELEPLTDLDQACACSLEYDGKLTLTVDEPLVRLITHYLETLE